MVRLTHGVSRRRSVFLLACLFMLALPLWIATTPPAFAQTSSGGPLSRHSHPVAFTSVQAQVLCHGKGCNHLDPYAMGCGASMYPVADAAIKGIGLVELEYSPVCQTNWTQVSGYAVEYLTGCVVRKAGPDGPSDFDCYLSTHYSWINTNMLWSPHNLDDASGCLVQICRGGPGGSMSGYYAETGYY